MKKIEKSEDDLLESFTNDAERRIKEQLVLREIVRAEELMADDKEVEEEIEKTGHKMLKQIIKLQNGIDKEKGTRTRN